MSFMPCMPLSAAPLTCLRSVSLLQLISAGTILGSAVTVSAASPLLDPILQCFGSRLAEVLDVLHNFMVPCLGMLACRRDQTRRWSPFSLHNDTIK